MTDRAPQFRFALAAWAAAALAGCAAVPRAVSPVKNGPFPAGKGGLRLTLALDEADLATGEDMVLRVEFRNPSDRPIRLPCPRAHLQIMIECEEMAEIGGFRSVLRRSPAPVRYRPALL